ncbi:MULTISPECIES: hypothetical protein [Pantoea]|uniref:hypothetical protein n=1 Tax=Pantoea TaxID=53335 RepID=UPI002580CCF2|nr:hypothetical protein [Pantoea sp. UBA5960]
MSINLLFNLNIDYNPEINDESTKQSYQSGGFREGFGVKAGRFPNDSKLLAEPL